MGAKRSPEDELQDWARLQVRAGFLDEGRMRAEVVSAIEAESPGLAAGVLAGAWLAGAAADLRRESATWPAETDHDRLQAVFGECAEHDGPVLQGVEDQSAANAELDRRAAEGHTPRGIAWFTAADVWHAVDEGMLEATLWHGSPANASPGHPLLSAVVSCFERHGLAAHFDEGRIEVAARWQRRPVG